jgi:hypothetical protein
VPKIALVVGILLIVVGGWAFTASGPGASPTALIPALLGLVLAVAGLVGLRGGRVRRHAMHAAAVVALIGILGSGYQLIARPSAGSEHADIAHTAGLLNLALCGGVPGPGDLVLHTGSPHSRMRPPGDVIRPDAGEQPRPALGGWHREAAGEAFRNGGALLHHFRVSTA